MPAPNEYPNPGTAGVVWSIGTNSSHIVQAAGSYGAAGEIQLQELWHRVTELGFWTSHMSNNGDDVIHTRQRTKEHGDIIHYGQIGNLTSAPIDNSNEMWGSENALNIYYDNILLGEVKKAMRWKRPLDLQRAIHDMREEGRMAMERWFPEYVIDKWIFRKLSGLDFYDAGGSTSADLIGEAATANTNVMYGGGATSTGTIDSSCTMSLELLFRARESARNGVISTTTIYKLNPVPLLTGGMGYKVVLDYYSLYDLTHDPDWKDIWKMDVRGVQSQLIKGEQVLPGRAYPPVARIDDMEIYSAPGIVRSTDWGQSGLEPGATNLFCGAQAGLLGWCIGPEWTEGFDVPHKEYFAIGLKFLAAFDKANFNSIDNGVIALKVYANKHYTNA